MRLQRAWQRLAQPLLMHGSGMVSRNGTLPIKHSKKGVFRATASYCSLTPCKHSGFGHLKYLYGGIGPLLGSQFNEAVVPKTP